MSNLTSRVLVIALLAPPTLAALYAGGWWLVALGVAVGVLGIHEFCSMTSRYRPLTLAAHLGVAGMLVGAQLRGPGGLIGPYVLAILLAFFMAASSVRHSDSTVRMAVTSFGLSYLGFGLGALLLLRSTGVTDTGRTLLLAVVLGVWASDLFAYVGGRVFGRRKLAPSISPNKTVEGFAFGFAATIAVVWWVLYAETTIGRGQAIAIGLAVAVAAPCGDLMESFLKRDLGVKDSGTLLGGHGGILDRIDALLVAAPAAYLALLLAG